MRFEKGRVEEELLPFYDEMGPDGVEEYWRRKNVEKHRRDANGAVRGLRRICYSV